MQNNFYFTGNFSNIYKKPSIKSEVTSQIIHSQGGILGIMQQPAIIQSFTTDNLWTLEQLDKLIPELVETKKFHDQEVEEKGAPKKV